MTTTHLAVTDLLAGLSDFDHMMACHVGIGYFDGTEITKEWDHLVRPAMDRLKAELAKPHPVTSASGVEAVAETFYAVLIEHVLVKAYPRTLAEADRQVAAGYLGLGADAAMARRLAALAVASLSPAATETPAASNPQSACAGDEAGQAAGEAHRAPSASLGGKEDTLFLAQDGKPILTGDVIRAPITINTELHGTWADYTVRKAPGGYLLSYLRSEKGQILPEGYTGGYMHDVLPDDCEIDLKTLVFTRVPIRVASWTRAALASEGRSDG